MEGWNVYLAILIDHSPAQAPQLVPYQSIIISASAQYPLAAGLNYDTRFRTLAVLDPTLCWDTHHTDLWLQYAISPSSVIRLDMLTLWGYKSLFSSICLMICDL